MTEYRGYENGIADILSFLARDAATVERNVRMVGRRSGKQRQVDILVRGRILGRNDAAMAVECKRWVSPLDIKDVEMILGMLDDLAVDFGLIVASVGYSKGARERVRQAAIHLETVTVDELKKWSPRGTVTTHFRLPAILQASAEKTLRHVGLRVLPDPSWSVSQNKVVLAAFRHYGTAHPSGDIQRVHHARCREALERVGAPVDIVSSGITVGGGTPAHQWLEVAVAGVGSGLKILAANREEAKTQVDRLAEGLNTPWQMLSVIEPEGWPMESLFASWYF